MSAARRRSARIAELMAIIESYRSMTVEDAELSDAGEREIEAEAELWRLQQDMLEELERQRVRAA